MKYTLLFFFVLFFCLFNLHVSKDHKDPSSDRGPQHQRGGFISPRRDRYQDYTQVILVTT